LKTQRRLLRGAAPLVCLISASIAKGTVGRLALGQIRPWESKVAVPG
jgi:hypothetical protein